MDMAFLSEVLEHLLDPKTALCQVAAYLKPGGYLAVDVPDYSQCHKTVLPVPNLFNQEHINYFWRIPVPLCWLVQALRFCIPDRL